MNDQDHAAAIRSAVNALNDAIGAAAQVGLRVEVEIMELTAVARVHPTPVVHGTVSRPERI